MFTQSMPALAQALSGALPEPALRQLMQALGNCQQPLTHRGEINLQPPYSTGPGGLARPGTWSPSSLNSLLPAAGQNVTVDIAGARNTVTNNNYGGHQFQFPLNQDFSFNQYFGGDTFNVAGDSVFNNTFHNKLESHNANIEFLTVKNITINNPAGPAGPMLPQEPAGPGEDGGGAGPGAGPFGAPGPFLPPQQPPAAVGVATYLKDVTVRGTVDTQSVTSAALKSNVVDITNKLVPKTVASTGSITVPTVEGVYLTAFTSSGTASLATVTGGTVSGGTASGNLSYDRCTTATCAAITAGTVSIFSGGTFSATPTGIAVAATRGSLVGQVTVPIVTGGYLDASCKLVLTTATTDLTVTLFGDPSATVTSQGTVTGTVTLTGATSRTLNIPTPAVTLTQSTATINANLPVSGATFTPITGSTNVNVSMTTATATFALTNGSQPQSFSATGAVDVNEAQSATVRDSTVTLTSGSVTRTLKLTVGKKSDFLVYLRPRF